jgi:hypothetical protein
LVNFGNALIPYIEVEPGLLVNPDDPSDKLALKMDGNQITLSPPLPFVFIKMPWYRTLPVHAVILVGGAILFLIAMVAWLVDFVRGLLKREKRPILSRLARMNAGLFGVFYLFFLTSFVAVFANTNPAFGAPDVFFGMPASFDQLLRIPTLLAILGILMLVFTLIAWTSHFWTGKSRFFYSVLTVSGVAIIWSLYFWNLLL